MKALMILMALALTGAVVMAQGMMQGAATTQPMDMKSRCEAMMKHMQQMDEKMKQWDQQLQQKVAAMDQATGQEKINAMADVISTMAAQRHEMFENREQRMQAMMHHMQDHMARGMDGQAAREMQNCPMNKTTKPAPGAGH